MKLEQRISYRNKLYYWLEKGLEIQAITKRKVEVEGKCEGVDAISLTWHAVG